MDLWKLFNLDNDKKKMLKNSTPVSYGTTENV
jgi:hypothetical protein